MERRQNRGVGTGGHESTRVAPEAQRFTRTDRVASVGPFDLGQPFQIRVEHVHLLHQTRQGGLGGFPDLLVNSLHL